MVLDLWSYLISNHALFRTHLALNTVANNNLYKQSSPPGRKAFHPSDDRICLIQSKNSVSYNVLGWMSVFWSINLNTSHIDNKTLFIYYHFNNNYFFRVMLNTYLCEYNSKWCCGKYYGEAEPCWCHYVMCLRYCEKKKEIYKYKVEKKSRYGVVWK